MIVDTTTRLVYSLLATTLLGAIMGYCVALLLARRRTRLAIESIRSEMTANRSSAEIDLKSARAVMADLRKSLNQTREQAELARQREEALEVHSQLQAQRIQTLESQVSSYEDQQIRLQRDFASYKSNKTRELELARNKPDAWAGANQLPVLQRRAQDPANSGAAVATGNRIDHSGKLAGDGNRMKNRQIDALSRPLSRELDIPSLSESELPDSLEDLEFDLADAEDKGDITSA